MLFGVYIRLPSSCEGRLMELTFETDAMTGLQWGGAPDWMLLGQL